MHNVDMNGFLNILLGIWGYMTSHGITLTIGSEPFTLTYAVIMMGVFCLTVVIDLINRIFWG